MSVKVDIVYEGGLHCSAKHQPSSAVLATDAPVDNQGKGESFSPTDLMAAALGSCMLTIMGIYAERHGIELKGASASVTKEMAATPFRRISRLASDVYIPLSPAHPDRAALEEAALTCPVHRSLHPEIQAPVRFFWVG